MLLSLLLFRSLSFLSVFAGTESDFSALAGAAKDPFSVLESLPVLVPQTQLCNFSQVVQAASMAPAAAASTPAYKIKVFPAAKFSRYVRERAWAFVVLEMRPFVDQPSTGPQGAPVGLSWIEVYGEPCALADSLAATERSLAASAQASSAAAAAMVGQDDGAWIKDAEDQKTRATKTGAAGFKPTGAAERAWAADQARAPPLITPAAASAAAAAPILSRNASFLAGLREGGNAVAAPASSASVSSSSPKPPPSCPTHPQHPTGMLRRADRSNPERVRTFYVCTATSAEGTPCTTKIYVD